MKKFLCYLLLLSVLIGSVGFSKVDAQAAGWPSYAQNVTLNKTFTDTGTVNDPYSLMDAAYLGVFRFQVPASGTVTLTLKSNTDTVPNFHIYKTNNTDDSIWYGYSGNRGNYDYDWSSGKYWAKWSIKLNKGSYYLMSMYHGGSMNVKYTYTLSYRPTFSNTAVTKVTAAKKALKLTWKKASGSSGYQIQYSLYKNMKGAKTVTVSNAGTTSRTIKSLKSGKRYYVRVRSYKKVKVGGKTKTYYGKWSGVKNAKVK